MTLSLACDHGGYRAKEILKKHLLDEGYEVLDFGTFSEESVDYPLFAFRAAKAVAEGKAQKGILICSSGEGVSICANKVPGIRCGIGYNDEVSHLLVEHNEANMIAFGAKFMPAEDILRRTDIFLQARPSPEERHVRRVSEITSFEASGTIPEKK